MANGDYDIITYHFCRCPVGHAGDTCDVKVDNPCEYITCQNSGRCEKLAEDKVKCHCHPGYTGKFHALGSVRTERL